MKKEDGDIKEKKEERREEKGRSEIQEREEIQDPKREKRLKTEIKENKKQKIARDHKCESAGKNFSPGAQRSLTRPLNVA